jgi:hypothetical protein
MVKKDVFCLSLLYTHSLRGLAAAHEPSKPVPRSYLVAERSISLEGYVTISGSGPALNLRKTYQALNPEPPGYTLTMYPTGLYDDFPHEGVSVTFGPDLRKRIGDTMREHCPGSRDKCRSEVMKILDNTDIKQLLYMW